MTPQEQTQQIEALLASIPDGEARQKAKVALEKALFQAAEDVAVKAWAGTLARVANGIGKILVKDSKDLAGQFIRIEVNGDQGLKATLHKVGAKTGGNGNRNGHKCKVTSEAIRTKYNLAAEYPSRHALAVAVGADSKVNGAWEHPRDYWGRVPEEVRNAVVEVADAVEVA